jgi:hypothetical protein
MLDFLKKMLKSKTMQFNGGAAILWFLGVLMEADFIRDNPELTAMLAGVVALINMLLRLKTNKPISEK